SSVRWCRRPSQSAVLAALTLALAAGGCRVVDPYNQMLEPPVPVQEQAPSEKAKVSLPSYRIEPPDILQIEMLKLVPLPPYRAEVFDVLQVRVANAMDNQPIDNYYMVEAEG